MARNGNAATMVETLRKVLRRKPFRPFTVTLADGDHIEINHPEAVIVPRIDLVMGMDRLGVGFYFGPEHFVSIRLGVGRRTPPPPEGPDRVRERGPRYPRRR